MKSPAFASTVVLVALLAFHVAAYIPARASNDTSGFTRSDNSTLQLKWHLQDVVNVTLGSNSSDNSTLHRYMYQAPVSYQIGADVPTGGISKGAFVYFNESSSRENRTTSTPWIAFINCEFNETNASDDWDIFTLARDRGAVAALLYTTTSGTCLINDEYINNSSKTLDIFTTISNLRAQFIEDHFQNTTQSFWYYDGALLNASATVVNQSLFSDVVPSRTFLIGTLAVKFSEGATEGSEPQADCLADQTKKTSTHTIPSPASTSTATSAGQKRSGSQSAAGMIIYGILGAGATLCLGV